jgi:chorismate synthase
MGLTFVMLDKLKYLTAGESHGQALVCILEGMPSNLPLSDRCINTDLARRQQGYGRGGRMKIESDQVHILSGVRHGRTLGSPLSLLIENRDWANWQDIMSTESRVMSKAQKNSKLKTPDSKLQPMTRPRPGHADLSGALKYNHRDLRNVLERSSARETAARVAIGSIAKEFLLEFDIKVCSYVMEIGGVGITAKNIEYRMNDQRKILSMFRHAEKSSVRCPDDNVQRRIMNKIKQAMKDGDTLGGVFEVAVLGVPAGLGSYSQWNRRLNSKLASAVMGIQAIKGVEIGLGFETARRPGSGVMDEIHYRAQTKKTKNEAAGGFYRKTNNSGGIEGGISSGMPIIVRAAMKPIPTLRSPLSSVDINSKKRFRAAYERSDTCAVPAASIIGESVTALVIADSFLDKFGGDSMEEIKRNYRGYLKQMRDF